MKKIILFVAIAASSFTAFSQALSYEDLGILFSRTDQNGSARFTSMSGAFGALGGDVSALSLNPAGISVFKNGVSSVSFNSRSTDFTTTYYGNPMTTQEEYFRLSNVGGVIVYKSYSDEWSNFAIGANYRILTDFQNTFIADGNSGFSSFNTFPLDPNQTNPTLYDFSDGQRFTNTYDGELSELSFGFAGTYQNNLHVGVGFNLYSLNFIQRATLDEFNHDGNGNTLDARYYQENFTDGTGFSLGAGFIYKMTDQFRFGLSYQSPTWFTRLNEETNILENDGYYGDTEISVSNNNDIYDNTAGGYYPTQTYLYKLKTPSKLTASAALVFGKFGLVSIDYFTKNYQNMHFSGGDFTIENQFFDTQLTRSNGFNAGTEWRFNRVSFRGGYRYEQSPDVNAINSDHLTGYSFGIGLNLGDTKLDFAYSQDTRTGIYNFYPQYSQVNPADIDVSNQYITATIAISL